MRKNIGFLLLSGLLAACSLGGSPAAATAVGTAPPPEQVTPTPPALVAFVNQEGISAQSYQANLALFQAAQAQTGTLLATEDAAQTVIDNLVDRLLLAQGARSSGFTVDETALGERLAALVQEAGGQDAFDAWLVEQGLSAELFREELRLEMEAAHMVAQISAQVPTTAEQVEARQILLPDSFSAERLLGQLEGGTPFETVVQNNDPQRLGTLGWFPRGYLLQPEVEEAAFALQPGEHSQVVQSALGFHLIEVIAREQNRPLSPQALMALQTKAVQDWLAQQRAQSTIEIRLPQ
jgi:parvulin-like peptidyl-prolyl isomerase